MKLEIENLKINYGEQKNSNGASSFNFSMNNLDLEKLDLNYALTNEKLKIADSEIKSSIIDATVFADVSMNSSNPANSNINEAQVKVMKLSPELQEMVTGLEQQMGKELPKEDGVIVLELTGKLGSPKIRGFEF